MGPGFLLYPIEKEVFTRRRRPQVPDLELEGCVLNVDCRNTLICV